jgi:hypothetical protein
MNKKWSGEIRLSLTYLAGVKPTALTPAQKREVLVAIEEGYRWLNITKGTFCK